MPSYDSLVPHPRPIPRRAQPVTVMPPVYELPINMWRWCRVDAVCVAVNELSTSMGYGLKTIPDGLVERFAALVRPNKPREGEPVRHDQPLKRILRFSPIGGELCYCGDIHPSRDESDLKIISGRGVIAQLNGFGPTSYVPEGWVRDLLGFVRLGLHSATVLQTLEDGVWQEQLYGTPYFDNDASVMVRRGKVVSAPAQYWAWHRGEMVS